tara:strand:+ start:1042 stop:4992 length:3951 start_codon:yes stop_codon:yes gene_type:complete
LPNCLKCKRKVTKSHLTCNECGKACHQKEDCSGLSTRDARENAKKKNDYTCHFCVTLNRPADLPPATSDNILHKSEPKSAALKRPLRILQWNAEGLNPKITELKCFMQDYKIDLALIQETKLMPKSATPIIKGFATVRGDRKGAEFPGGGLIIYVKEDIVFKSNGHCQRDAVELLSISVKTSNKKWLTINNIYIPPNGTYDLSWIPVKDGTVFAGDFNGHTQIWDEQQPSDSRGSDILDWVLNNDLKCLNDGSHTRVNRGTGGLSTPDITFTTPGLNLKSKWSVVEETDIDSDHLPIVTEIRNSEVQTISTTPFRARWKSKNVDWAAFRQAVEDAINTAREFKSLSEQVAVFNDILIEAGNKFVGKTKPARTKFAMNPKVKALVKKRNRLRKEVATRRKEWLDAAEEARLARKEAKQEAWTEFVESLEVDDDPSKVWRMIKSLDGAPTSSAPNEALSHNGKTMTTNKAKADTFAKHYAQVSTLTFSKEERNENRATKKKLYAEGPDIQCKPFTRQELKAAIRKMKRKGAPGGDNIPPSFLKELGPKAITWLLTICNLSFLHADIPQVWRHGVIIPLLKRAKPASEVESYRPISLTSCVVKLLERMLGARLYAMAETQGWLNNQQAGFRKGRSCEDQVVKLIQNISDGAQQKPAKRTVMALLDYSKAYDRTWRERLLSKLHDYGTPRQMTRWIAAFLRTRTAEVVINGTKSKRVRLKQGLPQGSVLSPLLFILFINDITKDIPADVESPLFADDASLCAMHENLDVAQDRLQVAVSAVEQWSLDNKLDLNVKKSCTFHFSNHSGEARWRPNIHLLGKRMNYGEGDKGKNPKFLGVTLDRTLSFNDHVTDVCFRVTSRCKMLFCLASRNWGWRKRNLRSIYITMQRSILDYAAAGWQPWLTKTQFDRLEVAQNTCLRAITGQYQNTSVEILRLEANIPSYRTHSNRLIATAYEKGMRLPEDHPRRSALQNSVKHRLRVRSSFREMASQIVGKTSLADSQREPINITFPDISEDAEPNWIVHTNEDIKDNIQKIGDRIDSIQSEVTVYTDGSCTGGVTNGGAAAVITDGPFINPNCIAIVEKKGNTHTCSYEEERIAMLLGIDWLINHPRYKRVAFCTDSLSLLQAMQSRHPDTAEIRDKLQGVCEHADLLFVPGHRDIPGNELADKHAKNAATMQGRRSNSVPMRTARTIIRKEINDGPIKHRLASKFYAKVKQDLDDAQSTTRKKAVLLAQVRSGHHKELAYYDNIIDPTESDACRSCTSGEVDDTEHWFTRCEQTAAARQRIFGKVDIDMVELALSPARTIELAESTLVNRAAMQG